MARGILALSIAVSVAGLCAAIYTSWELWVLAAQGGTIGGPIEFEVRGPADLFPAAIWLVNGLIAGLVARRSGHAWHRLPAVAVAAWLGLTIYLAATIGLIYAIADAETGSDEAMVILD